MVKAVHFVVFIPLTVIGLVLIVITPTYFLLADCYLVLVCADEPSPSPHP
jgi:hypothetical protein